jgi:predicted HicB family RNase H-like nuclease
MLSEIIVFEVCMRTLLDVMAERKRKAVSYRIDDLVIEAIQKAADNQGISANRWVELYLFDSLKNMGLIAQDEQKLGENRGGDRKSDKFKN